MCPRHSATICEKRLQIKNNLNIVVPLRKFGKGSEKIFSNYESGGRTFESFRARHFISPEHAMTVARYPAARSRSTIIAGPAGQAARSVL